MAAKNALEQIHEQLSQVFGGNNPNQFFTLQMPATALNAQTYAYDTSKMKPALVAEAESQLADQMFDLRPLCGGSNGQRLSSQFLQALSVLVPNYNRSMPLVKNTLREFINARMPTDTLLDGKPFVGSLQEYYFALYDQWVEKKMRWEQDQQEERKNLVAKNPDTANEEFLRWYEDNAEGRLGELDAAMGKVLAVFAPSDMDAIMGVLAAGPGGAIDEALDVLKDIRLPSPSGGWVYPVELTPSDWFLDLASDIDPVDLLRDPAFIAAGISARREALAASVSQVQVLLDSVPTPAAMQSAKVALSSAQQSYTKAKNDLLDQFADNTVAAAEIYLARLGTAAEVTKDAVEALNADSDAVAKAKGESMVGAVARAAEGPFGLGDAQKLVAGQKALRTAQDALNTSARALADAGMNLAATQSQNFANLPALLARLQKQLEDLTTQQQQLAQSTMASARGTRVAAPRASVTLSVDGEKMLQIAGDEARKQAALQSSTADTVAEAVKKKITGPLATELATVVAATRDAGIKLVFDAMEAQVEILQRGTQYQSELAAIVAAAKRAMTSTATPKDVCDAITKSMPTDQTTKAALQKVETDATGALAKAETGGFAQRAIQAAIDELLADVRRALPRQSPSSPRYMDLQLSFTSDAMKSDSKSNANFRQTSWDVDLFFGSASGSSSSSDAMTTSNSLDQSASIQIGLKATKVAIERDWFDPGLFKLTKDMSRIAQNRVSGGALPMKVTPQKDQEPEKREINWDSLGDLNNAIVPCFPVAFVVAKDVTVRFKANESSLHAVHSVLDSRSAVGGGFLCFSSSTSAANHEESQSLNTRSDGTVINLTIPGPQILGWFLELTPEDKSKELSVSAQPDPDINITRFVQILQGLTPSNTNAPAVVQPVDARSRLRGA